MNIARLCVKNTINLMTIACILAILSVSLSLALLYYHSLSLSNNARLLVQYELVSFVFSANFLILLFRFGPLMFVPPRIVNILFVCQTKWSRKETNSKQFFHLYGLSHLRNHNVVFVVHKLTFLHNNKNAHGNSSYKKVVFHRYVTI